MERYKVGRKWNEENVLFRCFNILYYKVEWKWNKANVLFYCLNILYCDRIIFSFHCFNKNGPNRTYYKFFISYFPLFKNYYYYKKCIFFTNVKHDLLLKKYSPSTLEPHKPLEKTFEPQKQELMEHPNLI